MTFSPLKSCSRMHLSLIFGDFCLKARLTYNDPSMKFSGKSHSSEEILTAYFSLTCEVYYFLSTLCYCEKSLTF